MNTNTSSSIKLLPPGDWVALWDESKVTPPPKFSRGDRVLTLEDNMCGSFKKGTEFVVSWRVYTQAINTWVYFICFQLPGEYTEYAFSEECLEAA